MSDKGLIAPYLASSLVNLFESGKRSQFNLIKDANSIKMNDFLMNGGIPNNLYSNLLLLLEIIINLLI